MRAIALIPELRAKRLAALKVYLSSPETIAKMIGKGLSPENLKHLKRLNSSPEHKEHLERLHKNSEIKAKRLAALKIYNSSPENKEHLKRLALQNKGRPRPEGSGRSSVSI